MGCDIHSIGQVKINGKWVTKIGSPGGDDRNYDSFAVLANVRNGRGFAGVETGEGWEYICDPKGLPDDLEMDSDGESAIVPPFIPDWDKSGKPRTSVWMGDHSQSWHLLSTLEETFEKFTAMEYTNTGVVDKETYAKLVEGTEPESWYGMISGGDVKVVTPEEVKAGKEYTHVKASWKSKASENLHTLKCAIEALRKLQMEYQVKSDEVRFVFGFDS